MSSSSEQQFRLAEIEVNRSTTDEKIVGVFRYESEHRTRKSPTVLILAEIASNLYVYEQLLDVINGAAEQARHLISGFDTDPMARFEKLIQKLNEAIFRFSEQNPSPLSWNRVNMFVLELSEGHLCLSGMGRLSNIFLQKQADGTHKPYDLFGSLEQPAEVNPEKPFGSLICGDIKPGDLLFAGTMNFERVRGEIALVERLTALPPVTAALEIKQELEARDIPDDFAGVVISCMVLPQKTIATTPPPMESEEEKKSKSTESIEKMYREEQTADAMLSPSVAPVDLSSDEETDQEGPRWMAPFKNVGLRLSETAKQAITNLKRRPQVKDPVALASLRGMNAGHGSFMTPKRKLTALTGVGVLILVIGGTFWYSQSKKAAAEQQLWNMTYDQAADKKNRAEAGLVYGNEDRARRDLESAQSLLASLDEKNTARKQAKEKLDKEINDVKQKLKKETRVDQPTILYSLESDALPQSLSNLVLFKEKLYVLEGSGTVTEINPLTKERKSISVASTSTIISLIATKTNLILVTSEQTLITLNPTTGSTSAANLQVSKAQGLVDLTLYGTRLYTLDPSGNMIWRYGASGNGFASEQAYLKQTTARLADATSIAIDSNVYIGFQSGRLMRYLSGVEESWTPVVIDPPLQNASKIWTSADTDRIVVLDTQQKRLVIFRKDTGALIGQIVSNELKDPKGLTGDEKLKKIYVTDSNQVLTFDLP